MALDFTLLTQEQIWGDDALTVIKIDGITVEPTDFAILLGGYTDSRPSRGVTWTSSRVGIDVLCVGLTGLQNWLSPRGRDQLVRPALSPSEASKITPEEERDISWDIHVCKYGEYPQTVSDKKTSTQLENLFQTQSLSLTGKHYTFDSTDFGVSEYNKGFYEKTYDEYEYNSEKYVRILGRQNMSDGKLSTGESVVEDRPYWVRVEPIMWLKDPTGTWVSQKGLFSGIQFDTKKDYDGDFSKTFMKHYLNTYFAKEIEPIEWVIDREVIKKLGDKLAGISDLEKLKKTVKSARTPERTEALVRIMRVRRAKAILSAAAQKAQREGNKKALHKIMEMAKPYAAREAAIRHKFRQKRLDRQARKGRD